MVQIMLEDANAAEKRGRRGGPKSKTGCNIWTRRIKCDETRPACLKCVRSGWTCPGYPVAKGTVAQPRRLEPLERKNSDSSSSSSDVVTTPPSSSTPSALSSRTSSAKENILLLNSETLIIEDEVSIMKPFKNPLLDFPGTREEHRLFDWYKARTAYDFEVYSEHSHFFQFISGQIGLMEKPVRHALIALAAVHENQLIEIETGYPVDEKFALTQYNKAIRSLNKGLKEDKVSHQLTLIMCLLFTCIDSMNKSPGTAWTHVRSGAALLESYAKRFSIASMDEVDKKLAMTFAGYRTGGLASYPVSEDEFYLPVMDQGLPTSDAKFTSIDEANDRLNDLIGWAFEPEIGATDNSATTVSAKEINQRLYMIEQLEKWAALLGHFMADRLSILTSEDLRQIRILRAHNVMAIIDNYALMNAGDGSMGYDPHIEKFETIIRLGEQIATEDERSKIKHEKKAGSNSSKASDRGSPDPDSPKPSPYQFEQCVTYPLAFTAEKCRSPGIRRRALDLLHRMMPQNDKAGFFERILRKVVDFEESQCLSPVTEDPATWPLPYQRIQETWHTPIYDHKRKTQTILFEWQPDGLDHPVRYHPERVCFDDEMVKNGMGGV